MFEDEQRVVDAGRSLSAALMCKSLANLGERLLARFGDVILGAAFVAVVFSFLLMWLEDFEAARFFAQASAFVFLPALDAICTAERGGSPGKLSKGLQVVDPDGQVPNMLRCAVRSGTVIVAFMVWWPLPLVVLGWAATNRERRGLHDLLAGTTVVRSHAHAILRSAI